jgi:hypothetical protein
MRSTFIILLLVARAQAAAVKPTLSIATFAHRHASPTPTNTGPLWSEFINGAAVYESCPHCCRAVVRPL